MAVDETVDVPLTGPLLSVRVIALYKGKDAGPFAYLQGIRSGRLAKLYDDPEDTEIARQYHKKRQAYSDMLAQAAPAPFDAILSPPSSMGWQAEPYRQAIAAYSPSAVDLTAAMSRTGSVKASEDASFDELLALLSYAPSAQEKDFKRIAIVDDTFRTGTTAAVIVTKLREHGLSSECQVILACPLWLDTYQ